MKTLVKYHACNHCVIDEKTFKNVLIGPGKLWAPGHLAHNWKMGYCLVPKVGNGLGPSLHIVQIASYGEMNTIARNITQKLVSLPSVVMFHCVVTRL